MGSNLGSFAGGMAQGLYMGAKLKGDREDREAAKAQRERDNKRQDEEDAYKKGERERAARLRERRAAMLREEYGDESLTDIPLPQGPAAAPAGNIAAPPVAGAAPVMPQQGAPAQGNLAQQPAQQPPKQMSWSEEQARFLRVFKRDLQLRLEEGGDMDSLKKSYDYVRSLAGNQEASVLIAAMQGDPKAVEAFAASKGARPEQVKFTVDPKTKRRFVDWGTGAQDLSLVAGVVAGHDAYKMLNEQHERGQGDEKHDAEVKLRGAQTKQAEAAATENYAQAGAANARKSLDMDERSRRDVEGVLLKLKRTDATDLQGKAQWNAPVEWALARVMGADKKDNPRAIAADSIKVFQQIEARSKKAVEQAASDPNKMKALSARYGGEVRPQVLLQRLIEDQLGMN